MSTGLPEVSARNRAMSSGTRHGRAPSRPMTRVGDWAQTSARLIGSDRYRGLDGGVVLVAHHLDVLVLVLKDRRGLPQPQRRVRVGVARELLGDLLADRRITVRRPAPVAQFPNPRIIEEVIHGLQAL